MFNTYLLMKWRRHGVEYFSMLPSPIFTFNNIMQCVLKHCGEGIYSSAVAACKVYLFGGMIATWDKLLLKALRWRKRDENKPVGNMGDRNIQGCDQHKEATQSHICVLSSFT
jgi:hypothetical protein